MSPELQSRVLSNIGQLLAICDEWRNLYGRCPIATPFQRPEWIISWAETFSPERVCVLEVRSGSKLVGLAPFLIYPRGEERVLAFMAGGVSDYLDLLLDPQYECEVIRAIFHGIQELDIWTVLDLTDLSANSVLHRSVFAKFAIVHDQCSSIELPQTPHELLQQFSKRQRANLRQAHARVQKAGGASVEVATRETLPEFLKDLFRLHSMRWLKERQSGVLADEKVKAFHLEATPQLLDTGILRLYRLRMSTRTVAAMYTLFDQSTVFCYLQGYDPDFAALSPGTYLMFAVMEEAIRAGANKFDLLRGEEVYKQHWRASRESTYRIQVARTFEIGPARPDLVAA